MIIEVLAIAVLVVIGLSAFLYFWQDRMIFYPVPTPANLPRPASGSVEELALRTVDGERLVAWLVRPARGGGGFGAARALRTAQRIPLVIYFGGNAEDVSGMIESSGSFAGYALLLVNYRGYGPSTGKPGESALFSDALAWFDLVAARADIDPQTIVAMGRSLGTGVAVHLAASRKVKGVVLVSPYDSVRSVAQSVYPFFPVGLLLKHPFDSLSRAAAIRAPLLCIAAQDDGIIPQAHSRRLYDAWGAPDKIWRALPGDHNNLSDQETYWVEIAGFLGGLAARWR